VQQAELLPKTVVVSRSFRSRSLISHKGPYPVLLPHIHYLLTHPALYPIRFYNFLPERNTTEERPRKDCRLRAVFEEGKGKNLALFRMWIVVHAPMATLTASSSTCNVRSPCADIAQPKEMCSRRTAGASILQYWNALFSIIASNQWPRTDYGTFYYILQIILIQEITSDKSEKLMYR